MEKIEPLVLQSFELLIIGMGTVFIILGVLIFLINLVTKLVIRLKLDEEAPEFNSATGAARAKPDKSDGDLIAVISSAIARYRKQSS